MNLEILESPLPFHLHGLTSAVEHEQYGPAGLRLMDAMWKLLKDACVQTTGINYWVYLPDGRMFVGVEVSGPDKSAVPEPLESCEFELQRYLKYLHIGPYHELPRKWRTLMAELARRGEKVGFPSLEVYGHACEDGSSEPETMILMGLHPRGV